MKSIYEMTYSEMVFEIKRVKDIISNSKSNNLKRDLYKYLNKLKKEIAEYNQFRYN